MLVILHIASGKNNISSPEISPLLGGAPCVVYNLDIEPTPVEIAPDAVLPFEAEAQAKALFAIPKVGYADATNHLAFDGHRFRDASVDIIASVSPYGFSLINEETVRVLKRRGVFFVAGSQSNPYVVPGKKECLLFASANLHDRVVDIVAPPDVVRVCTFIQEKYVSRVTHGNRTTKIDVFRVLRKIA